MAAAATSPARRIARWIADTRIDPTPVEACSSSRISRVSFEHSLDVAFWNRHGKDYDPAHCEFDFVFTVSNFRLCVVNLQPLEESFEVWCFRSSDGVSSLDFGPAFQRGFFCGHSGNERCFFPYQLADGIAALIEVEAPSIPKKDHILVK
jgi:hypothetical protein